MDQAGADAASMPYIGSKISLISNAEIRYEGILYSINTYESTVALQNVRTFGTEGRRQPEVHPNNKTYQFIIFKGKDIKDLTVCEPASVPEDPAIVTVNVPPTNAMIGQPQSYMNRQPGPESAATNCAYGGANMGNRNGRITSPPYHMRSPNTSTMRGGYYGRDLVNNHRQGYENYGMAGNEMDYSNAGRGGRYPNRDSRFNNRTQPRNSPRRIVGELPPQLNHAMIKEVQKAFDFESSNAKFDRAQISDSTKESAKEGEATEGHTISVAVPSANKGYDKVTSFFDRISCETIDRKDGKDARMDKVKQRQLDCDTFGPSAADASRGLGPRRAYRRGGPNRRGGFGYGGVPVRANA